jgi:type I restriction enzyme M protein
MANGSLTTNAHNEGTIREALVRADVVDCIVALPGKLFFSTPIPVSLWFFDRDKRSTDERQRPGELLFIDARHLGRKISRTQIELTADEISLITSTYHAWRGQAGAGGYADVAGFCRAAPLSEIEAHAFALGPGRYVGAPEEEEDEIAFEERIGELVAAFGADLAEVERLDAQVRESLEGLGYGV